MGTHAPPRTPYSARQVHPLPAVGRVLAAASIPFVLDTGGVPSAKLFIAPMPDDFNQYLAAAITAKKVPVNVVSDKSTAEFEVTGHSETEKAGAAKKAIMLNWHS